MEGISRLPAKEPPFEGVGNVFFFFLDFLVEHQFLILILSLIIAGLVLFKKKFNKKQKYINKIWTFTLFFLTKRQMMIPLVFVLSQKDGVLDKEALGKLLEIRNECREKSLKKNPTQRLILEQKISKILFYYFSTLEEEGKIKPNTKFDKIVKDLEFIDAKLVQLQQVYNAETEKWNRLVLHKTIWWLFYIFKFRKFKKFEMPKNDTH